MRGADIAMIFGAMTSSSTRYLPLASKCRIRLHQGASHEEGAGGSETYARSGTDPGVAGDFYRVIASAPAGCASES
ncbi:hypothetical protein KCP76_18415 [Salmonella enterica subsp. enterica serovar Weltevreden]|nr:hypothetical protein KCP76_18415 [Salmonella enterica subsp. enterica serovar Weltevreden]